MHLRTIINGFGVHISIHVQLTPKFKILFLTCGATVFIHLKSYGKIWRYQLLMPACLLSNIMELDGT